MSLGTQGVVFLFAVVSWAICVRSFEEHVALENGLKSKVYLSPKITLHPGSVSNKTYYDIKFPRGHIAVKSFNAEVVDEAGNPVSLQQTYVHHWTAARYYQRNGVNDDRIIAGNAGLCDHGRSQFFGMGPETRKTSTYVPDPFGIEVGNPLKVPAGYEEKWMFNIHAIDIRGAVDAMGCNECRCDLYNVTVDKDGQPLKPGYVGGLYCCYDGTHCKVNNGFDSFKRVERSVYFKYTVKWVDWSDSIIPVKVFIFDVTDTWQHSGIHDCLFEYDVEKSATNNYTNTRRSSVSFPTAGYVIYGFAQQYIGATGSALYGEDGRVICASKPVYGKGKDIGDEAGYIVGMSTCYPKPGSVTIAKGETVTLESYYNSKMRHTGVLGLFYILVAESS